MGRSDCVKVESRHLASPPMDYGSLILMCNSLIGQLEFPGPGTHRDGKERFKLRQEGNLEGSRELLMVLECADSQGIAR